MYVGTRAGTGDECGSFLVGPHGPRHHTRQARRRTVPWRHPFPWNPEDVGRPDGVSLEEGQSRPYFSILYRSRWIFSKVREIHQNWTFYVSRWRRNATEYASCFHSYAGWRRHVDVGWFAPEGSCRWKFPNEPPRGKCEFRASWKSIGDCGGSVSRFLWCKSRIPCGLVARIPGSHPGGPGSIPGTGNGFSFFPPCFDQNHAMT